jgi:hypothetical protein
MLIVYSIHFWWFLGPFTIALPTVCVYVYTYETKGYSKHIQYIWGMYKWIRRGLIWLNCQSVITQIIATSLSSPWMMIRILGIQFRTFINLWNVAICEMMNYQNWSCSVFSIPTIGEDNSARLMFMVSIHAWKRTMTKQRVRTYRWLVVWNIYYFP